MAKKVILKDKDNVELLPITRGELILDSSGKEALHSNEFLATKSLPGLMSKEDKEKIDGLVIDSDLSTTSTNPVQNKVVTSAINSIKNAYLKSADVEDNTLTIVDLDDNEITFNNTIYDVVNTSANGLAPKLINTKTETINASYYILASADGKTTPSWYKLPESSIKLVTNSKDGIVPKFDSVDGTIDNATNDWVLTVNNGTLGWYKLPANSFKNTTYSIDGNISGGYKITLTDSSKNELSITVPIMNGATSSSKGSIGLVPAASTALKDMFLKADGSWATPDDTHYTTHLYVGAKSSNNKNDSNSETTNTNTYLKLFDNSTLRHQYNIKGTGRTTVSSDTSGNISIHTPNNIDWDNIDDKPETFTPSAHKHSTDEINKLTSYVIADEHKSLETTDTLNLALGKLEFTANTAFNFYTSIMGPDIDEVINKYDEIVDFVDSVKEGEDISEAFMTTGTNLNVTGVKNFKTQQKFTVAKGSPFTVTSTTKVDNLNADYLDGLSEGAFVRFVDKIDSSSTTKNVRHMGYGYAAEGWKGSGPAISIGATNGYIMQMQQIGETLYVRHGDPSKFTEWKRLAYTATTDTGNVSTANKVANDFTLKINSGTTEGTDKYTYNGSTAKTLNIKPGSNVSFSTSSGELTINSSYVNTTYSLSGALSNTNDSYTVTLTPSSGSATTATISKMVGATTSTAGKAGLVPKPGTGDVNSFLKGDGSWGTPVNTWRPVSVNGTSVATSTTGTGTLNLKSGTGISVSGTAVDDITITNAGVRSVAIGTGSNSSKVAVNTNGTTAYLTIPYATKSLSTDVLNSKRYDNDDPTPNTTVGTTFLFSYINSTWYNVLTMKSYSDNNYTAALLATPAGNPGADTGYSGNMQWRLGRNSTWLGWKTILDSSNSSVSGEGGSTWGSSITVKINGTSKTLTIPANPNTWRPITDEYDVTTSSSTTSLSQTGAKSLQRNVRSFKRFLGTATTGGYDLNTLTEGMVYNYGSTNYWKNGPSGMYYGRVLNLKDGSGGSIAGLLAWDTNHGSTTDTTRYLWWRVSDDGSFTEAKWHRIAYVDEIPIVSNYYWANVPISAASNDATTPTFATATATTQVTTPKVHSEGRLTLNATETGLDLKFENNNAKSVILNGTAFRPFDDANNKLTLGSSKARWSNIYSVLGNFTGNVTIKKGNSILDENGWGIVGINPTGWTGLPSDGSAIGFGTGAAPVYIRTNSDNLYHYHKTNNASYKILDSNNSSVTGAGGSTWGSSITVKINGTTKTLTIPANPNTWRPITNSYSGTATDTSLSLKGANDLYNALVNGNASTLDNLDSTDFLRNVSLNGTFSSVDKISTSLIAGIHRLHIAGVEYSSILTGYDWNGSYWLLYFHPSSGYTLDIRYRATNCSTWKTLLDSNNSSVSGEGGSTWGSSITVKINGTSKTLTIPSNPNTWRGITDSYSGTDSAISLSQKGANSLYNALVNGYASSAGYAGYISSGGRLTCATTTNRAAGLRFYEIYNNGYPFTYGNVILFNGASGVGLLACQWHGTGLAYRSAPDTSTTFTEWATILTSTNSSVSGSGSSWGSSITVKINGTAKTLTIPSNPNTHWTTRIYAGASGTATNTQTTNPYLKVTDDNTYRNLVRFVGGGTTTVSSDANGTITISSTATTYSFRNNNPTLAWGTQSIVGTVGGVNLTVTMPANPNVDTKVTQTPTSSDATYPLLLAPSGQTSTKTTTSYFDSGVTLNPSTNLITANISGYSKSLLAGTTSNVNSPNWRENGISIDLYTQAASNKPYSYNNANGVINFSFGKHSTSGHYGFLLAHGNNSNSLYFRQWTSGSAGAWQQLAWADKLTTIDASSLSESMWYPVTISLTTRSNIRIMCLVALDSGSKPTWSTHKNGFSVRKIWETNGNGWGTTPISRRIFASDYNFASSDPVRGIGLLTNGSIEYVYVRGGGKYFFYTSNGVTPVLRTSSYTNNSQTVSPTSTAPAVITTTYIPFSNSSSIFLTNYNSDGGVINFKNTYDNTKVGIRLYSKDTNKGGLWWESGNGVYLYNTTTSKYIGILDDTNGTPYYYDGTTKRTLYHTGNLSVPSFGAKGSATKGVYLSGTNTFAAMTYSLNATVNSGTANKLAYYSGVNAISAYTSSCGSSYEPIYLNAGIPTACSTNRIGTVTWGTNSTGYLYVYLFGPITIIQGYINKINTSATSSSNYVFKLPENAKPPSTSCGVLVGLSNGSSNDRNTLIILSGAYGYCSTKYNAFNPNGSSYYISLCYM